MVSVFLVRILRTDVTKIALVIEAAIGQTDTRDGKVADFLWRLLSDYFSQLEKTQFYINFVLDKAIVIFCCR